MKTTCACCGSSFKTEESNSSYECIMCVDGVPPLSPTFSAPVETFRTEPLNMETKEWKGILITLMIACGAGKMYMNHRFPEVSAPASTETSKELASSAKTENEKP